MAHSLKEGHTRLAVVHESTQRLCFAGLKMHNLLHWAADMIARRATLDHRLQAEAVVAVACVEEEHAYTRYEREQLGQASGDLRWASKDVLKGSSSTIHLELDLAVV